MAFTYFESTDWTSAGTAGTGGYYKDISLTGLATGDLLVAVGAVEGLDGASDTASVTTTAGSTSAWTTNAPTVGLNDAGAIVGWATVSSGTTATVRVQLRGSDTYHMGAAVWKIPAAEWSGTPALSVNTPDATNDDATISLTLSATSTVLYVCGDWAAATASTTSTPATNATNHESTLDSGRYTVWVRSWTGQAAGTRSYGPGSVTAADSAIAAAVVQEPAAGVAPVTYVKRVTIG